MANNVYVGSRYVPIFDGTWSNSKTYEALTIVEYGNSSYTSKKPVPAGTLPTNTKYWALTGNYNGQITNLQSQINSLNNLTDSIYKNVEIFRGKKILILGDSTSNESVQSPNWVTLLKNLCNNLSLGTTINNQAIDGASLVGIMQGGLIDNISGTYDFIFIGLGLNDCTGQVPIGFPSSTNNTEFLGALNNLYSKISTKWFNAKVFYLIPNKTNFGKSSDRKIRLNVYRSAIHLWCTYWSWNMIDLTQAPWLSPINSTVLNTNMQAGIHPKASYAPTLLDYILKKVNCGGDNTIAKFYDKLSYSSLKTGFSGVVNFLSNTDGKIFYDIYITTSLSGLQTVVSGIPDVYRAPLKLLNQNFENVGLAWDGNGNMYLQIPSGTTSISGKGEFVCPNLELGVDYSF